MSKPPKKISLSAKCSDCCSFALIDADGNELKETHDYVPYGMGVGGGDYVDLEINFETGQIINWKKPSDAIVKEFIGENEDEERGGGE